MKRVISHPLAGRIWSTGRQLNTPDLWFYLITVVKGGKIWQLWRLVILLSCAVLSFADERGFLKCLEGNAFSFECPCPEKMNSCTFKKVARKGNIFENGTITLPSTYELDEQKTHIKIKKCDRNDGGAYVWDCGECGEKEFRVVYYRVINESLKCAVGSEVSFKCLCCIADLDTCSFVKNLSRGLYIVTDGKVNDDHPRYRYNERKTHMVLRDCKEEDKGTYNWKCSGCDIYSQFLLAIEEARFSIWNPSSAILLILAVIFVKN